MFTFSQPAQRRTSFGAYVATVILLSLATVWCVSAFGAFVMTVIDDAVLDGSGHAAIARVEAVEPDDEPEETAAPAPSEPKLVPVEARVAEPLREPARVVTPLQEVEGEDPATAFHNGRGGTYKTYCVRLCDGYFWPVSFSTTSDRFEGDRESCESSCGSPARLFVHPTPGGSAATMQSLEGLPYGALKTAFLFRTRFDSQCTCRAHPWEKTAQDRHRLMAAQAAATRGDAAAKSAAQELASKVAKAEEVEAAQKKSASETATRDLAKLAAAVGAKPLPVAAARTSAVRIARSQDQPFPGDGPLMRLGGTTPAAETTAPARSGGYRAASGSSQRWEEKAFSGQ